MIIRQFFDRISFTYIYLIASGPRGTGRTEFQTGDPAPLKYEGHRCSSKSTHREFPLRQLRELKNEQDRK